MATRWLTQFIGDALLGAARLGDIGNQFPDPDQKWKCANTLHFLHHVRGLIAERGLRISHLDAIVIMEKPKLGPHFPLMRQTLARVLRHRLGTDQLKSEDERRGGCRGPGRSHRRTGRCHTGKLGLSAVNRKMEKLTGIHAVREALAAGRPLQTVMVGREHHGERIAEIVSLAKRNGVPVRFEDRAQLDRAAGTRSHQGVVGLVAARSSVSLEDLLARKGAGGVPGLLVILDGVEDPQNLGAIIRTALAAGADGVVIPERRAAGLTEAAARASAGAVAHLPVARVTNISRAIEELKEGGYWVVGLDERAEKRHSEVDLSGPIALALGGEGKGLHELVRQRCDFLASIPTTGPVASLNVSVAAGVALFEVVRQRSARASKSRTTANPGVPDADR